MSVFLEHVFQVQTDERSLEFLRDQKKGRGAHLRVPFRAFQETVRLEPDPIKGVIYPWHHVHVQNLSTVLYQFCSFASSFSFLETMPSSIKPESAETVLHMKALKSCP